jgi:hypothetical protein
MSYGITTRLPRVSNTEMMRYKEWDIPMGVSAVLIHRNIFDGFN